ncbi:hypothetical protein CISG_00102 [Coccidioides immitis RMSCC 3703]|uniref:F-box domain-containing protein n=1 Tax=Coccidioides immitis RMSCC 3703 TaxID=454286 RepID=A0A0J8TE43_COCIT|nr:hypothetical protein CISG_00102 [Coccidioides immitis RMSCC 3703]
MSVVARRPPESPRMSYSRSPPPPSYRDGSPHRQSPSPTHPRVVVPPSPRSSSFSYMNHHYSNSNAPNIYSPTAPHFPFRSVGRNPAFPDTPSPTFPKHLPQEVYECIVLQLQLLHNHGEGCITCFVRDLYSLSLTSRAWERAVRLKLYQKVHIHGADAPGQLKRYRWKRGSRLKLLRRTLRERKLLANAVLELRVPELDLLISTGKYHAGLQEYVDLVASVVMVCPNLERLLGITLPYTHEFDRLTHALSTRKKLREHAWIIGENAASTGLFYEC